MTYLEPFPLASACIHFSVRTIGDIKASRETPDKITKFYHSDEHAHRYQFLSLLCNYPAMEIDEIDDDDVEYYLNTDAAGTGTCNVEERDKQLLKLQQYIMSETCSTRHKIGKILVAMFRTAVNNGTKFNVSNIMQSVERIAEDPDTQIRSELVEQLPHVAMICQEAPHLFGDVLHDHLLDIIIKFLRDTDSQVQLAAQAAVVALTGRGLLDITTIELKLCPVIEILCSTVDSLNMGLTLMRKMAPFIGKELTEKTFLDRYITLCKDKEFYVRRTCITHFGQLCAAVGRKAMNQKLFPIFADLCRDRVWGIRKACVDVLMPVACCTSLIRRRIVCTELLATHLKDEAKWVRMSAFQILGPFISTLATQFAEVSYNQQGELVFTSQEDTRFSIKYSYGIYAMKCSVQSLALDAEEQSTEESYNSSLIMRNPIAEEDESQEEHISAMKALRLKIQQERNKTTELEETPDESEKYSSFLYHYVPPELAPNDELVEAAKKSSALSNNDRDIPTDTITCKESTLDHMLNKDSYPAVEFPVVEFPAVEYPPYESSTDKFPVNKPGMVFNWSVEDIVPQHLIDSFLSMAEPEQCSDMNADLPHYCAFSFPAVVLTLGKENWPYLKQAYQALASANQYKVRSTLASSIHEIAMILGQELTATDLVPIYDGFIKDLDEVRIGVLKHLATFLRILTPTYSCQYLPRLKVFLATDNVWNWRFREELATQLLEIVDMFGAADVRRYIVPLSLKLLSDKVAAVRHVALSLVTQIVAHLSDNERLVIELFQELRYTLGVYACRWKRRQTFALVCSNLIANNAISGHRFSQEMLPNLLKLSTDKVPNVRLAVARTLSKNVVPMGHWLGVEQAEVVAIRLREMQLDPDRDVRILAGGDYLC
ncbi:serine/threonine-protein phosphatase 4 regulatory subunit 1 isoform X2 [Ptiloglossa arizonensis]|uniref:serine/threonine-protein phosphatase 4 regulatory subunit 1 isoform X2 n=1 Tax=Ptiloglossa arizonensis TaxID=3350558 RepID=UPI003FA0373F